MRSTPRATLSAYSSLGCYNDGWLGSTTSSNDRALMDAQTLQACTNAEAPGIQIDTVGFSIPSDHIDGAGLFLQQSYVTKTKHGLCGPGRQRADHHIPADRQQHVRPHADALTPRRRPVRGEQLAG